MVRSGWITSHSAVPFEHALTVTCRSRAEKEGVISFLGQMKQVREHCQTVNPAKRTLQGARDVDKQVVFKKTENLLRGVQYLDKGIASTLVSGDGAIEKLEPIITARMGGRRLDGLIHRRTYWRDTKGKNSDNVLGLH